MNSSSFFRGLPVPDFLQRKLCQTAVASKRKKQKQENKNKNKNELWRSVESLSPLLFTRPKGGVHSYRRVFAAFDPLSPSRELVASERHSG